MKNEIRSRLINIMQNVDIFIDDACVDDIDVRNYISSSIQFISLIVEIEKEFNIEIPDEMFVLDNFSSLNVLSDIIFDLMKTEC